MRTLNIAAVLLPSGFPNLQAADVVVSGLDCFVQLNDFTVFLRDLPAQALGFDRICFAGMCTIDQSWILLNGQRSFSSALLVQSTFF